MAGWSITLEIHGPGGERFGLSQKLDDDVVYDHMVPIDAPRVRYPMGFDQLIIAMKRREFRKDLLERAARQIALALSEHLEDAEGWHGEDRRERMRRHMGFPRY